MPLWKAVTSKTKVLASHGWGVCQPFNGCRQRRLVSPFLEQPKRRQGLPLPERECQGQPAQHDPPPAGFPLRKLSSCRQPRTPLPCLPISPRIAIHGLRLRFRCWRNPPPARSSASVSRMGRADPRPRDIKPSRVSMACNHKVYAPCRIILVNFTLGPLGDLRAGPGFLARRIRPPGAQAKNAASCENRHSQRSPAPSVSAAPLPPLTLFTLAA